MSGFPSTRFASVMFLLVILTGPSSALFWRPEQLIEVKPTYPPNPKDPYYQAFKTVPPPAVTAKKLLTNFLGYSQITKRQTRIEDVVIVMDGSGSVGYCEFKKGKEALMQMMETLHNPSVNTKYAAVTFANRATVNFKFLPYARAASEMKKMSYPNGGTNTQAGLAEAKKLFDDPNSGRRAFTRFRKVLLVTDGQSNIHNGRTIPNADALKKSGIELYVVAVGAFDYGIDEIVKVASYPPEKYLFRVKDMGGFWDIVKLMVQQVAPGKYSAVNYNPPC